MLLKSQVLSLIAALLILLIAANQARAGHPASRFVIPIKAGYQLVEVITLGPIFLAATALKIGFDSGKNTESELLPRLTETDGKTATLLLHGKGANDCEFYFAKKFLSQPVFSFNYVKDENGQTCYLSNPLDLEMRQAAEIIRDKIKLISRRTGISRFNLVGHSLGGIMAMIYAEEYSESEGIEVNKVITINSPLQGTPTIPFLRKYSYGLISLRGSLYDEMQESNVFLHGTRGKAIESVQMRKRNYYHINGRSDLLVPTSHGILRSGLCPNVEFFHAHYGAAVDPRVWTQIQNWLEN